MTRSMPARLYQLAVEQHDLPSRRQVLNVALEKPLAAFDVARLFQSHDARAAGVHMLHKSFDGAAFTGRVAPLKQYDDPLPLLLHRRLELEQLCLQLKLLCFVVLAKHLVFVGATAGPPIVSQLVARAPQLFFCCRLPE